MTHLTTVLIVGATGSIGRLVTAESIRHGYATRALVRHASARRDIHPEAQIPFGWS
ncbi:NmrA family NAD(P)-binding protein [Glaciihabitans sp. dw_435]|uniref:NmrA family NAD(P)-binding protein n=1 Tax=Glaciihabitans sp. dw_435 TaxID=2720081 RepID=UPI001BD55F1F|nr:NmrA family NAD(P)-binding protein [Glaciihabitans sp. dw_435]